MSQPRFFCNGREKRKHKNPIFCSSSSPSSLDYVHFALNRKGSVVQSAKKLFYVIFYKKPIAKIGYLCYNVLTGLWFGRF